jgi:PKD-like domain/Secretion system C-terminal sorting domain
MKKFKIIFLINTFLLSVIMGLQAQVLDYTTVNYPTALCNVFNTTTLKVVGGLTHYPVSGGVSYNASSLALALQTKGGTGLSTTFGTAYAFAITIKQGYKYNITVNAAKSSADPVSSPSLEIGAFTSLPNPNTTNPGVCGAVNQNSWTVVQANTINGAVVNNSSFANYPVVQNFVPTMNYSYITILAHSGSQTQTSTVLIKSITITETPPPIVFTLSPTAVSTACGSTITQTFTVTNVNSSPGVTSYEWNLGSANNGWRYNGNPAPQNISTPANVNTLALTSTACSALQNVAVTVKINNVNNTTLSATASTVNPGLAITTNSSGCSSGNYSVSGIPCGGSVTSWSADPPSYVNLAPSGNSVSVTKNINGSVVLTAMVSTGCNSTAFLVTKTIYFGGFSAGDYQINPVSSSTISSCTNTNVTFTTNPLPGAINYNWLFWPTGWTYISGQGTPTLVLRSPSTSGGGAIGLRVANACDLGGSPATKTLVVFSCGFLFTASPNPSTGSLTISTTPDQSQSVQKNNPTKIYQVKILDQLGNIKRQYSYKAGIVNTNINLSGLIAGIYTVRAYDGTIWSSQQVIKQ